MHVQLLVQLLQSFFCTANTTEQIDNMLHNSYEIQ